MGIFARVSIKNGLRPWCHTYDVIAWFILDKSVFGLENDLYLGCVNIVPENSTYLKHNEYDLLLDDVAKIPSDCGILLCGDYNARTNVLSDHDDYVSGSDGDLRNLMPTHMSESCHMISVLNEMGRLVRFSRDKAPANRHGSRLIDFCKATDMIIFNGRLGHGHGLGEFTRDDTTGRSVVDYAIGSPVISNQVDFFKVLDKVPESDHRPLSIWLSINYHCHNDKQIEEPEWQVTHKYIWHRDSLSQLPHIMCDERSQLFHDDLCDSISNLCDIDIVAGKLDLYISQACERAFSRTSCVRKNKKGPAWFDYECRLKRSLAVKAGERVTNREQKHRQQDACRRYRACKQKKQRIYTNKCIGDIKSAFNTNKSNMWRVIQRISNENRVIAEPGDNEFYEYFKGLSSEQDVAYFDDELEEAALAFLNDYDSGC